MGNNLVFLQYEYGKDGKVLGCLFETGFGRIKVFCQYCNQEKVAIKENCVQYKIEEKGVE